MQDDADTDQLEYDKQLPVHNDFIEDPKEKVTLSTGETHLPLLCFIRTLIIVASTHRHKDCSEQ
jgi:hypothetical protein